MKVEASVLRLDLVHPVVSGNKWFKLKYYIRAAIDQRKQGLVSFGGVYSNHLVAMAYACAERNLKAVAFVRGEDHPGNHSLNEMKKMGMDLIFVTREQYRYKDLLLNTWPGIDNFISVPEGGQGIDGIRGISEIIQLIENNYTHVVCPVGTGTTLTGLINGASATQKVIGICALKVQDQSSNDLLKFVAANTSSNNYHLLFNYHFGGYARKTDELITFMNTFYLNEKIPTDFVYTAKMFFAVEGLIADKYFPEGSKILALHTGGLQGNRSLPSGTLVFN